MIKSINNLLHLDSYYEKNFITGQSIQLKNINEQINESNTIGSFNKYKLYMQLLKISNIQKHEQKFNFTEFYVKVNTLLQESGLFDLPHNQYKILLPQFNGIGDAILTTGFVRETRRCYPQANITYIGSPGAKDIYDLCPYINKLIILTFQSYIIIDLFQQILNYCYQYFWNDYNDLSIISHRGENNIVALFFSWLSGSKQIIGFGENNWWYTYSLQENKLQEQELQGLQYDNNILTRHITPPIEIKHDLLAKYYILNCLGFAVQDLSLECWLSQESLNKANMLTKNIPGKKIALGIGGTIGSKKYPINKLIIALQQIYKYETIKPTFYIIGGLDEFKDAQNIIKEIPNTINCTIDMSVQDSFALISLMNMYIGNDTSAVHMASIFNIPIIELSQEAVNNTNHLQHLSLFHRFRPWTANAVIIRPLQPLDKCKNTKVIGGCKYDHPHCITQIKPRDIVKIYQAIAENNMDANIDTNKQLKKLTFKSVALN